MSALPGCHGDGQLMVSPPSCAANSSYVCSKRPGTFLPSPLVNLCHSARQETNYSLKTTGLLQSQPRATPPGEQRPLVVCTPWNIDYIQRTARSPSGHVLTPQPIYFHAGQTLFPLLLCRVSSSLLCIMQLENMVAYFSVACMNSFILILNRFLTLLRFLGLGYFLKKMQMTMKSNY